MTHCVDIALTHEDCVVGADQHRTERMVAVSCRVAGDGIGSAEVGDHLVARHIAGTFRLGSFYAEARFAPTRPLGKMTIMFDASSKAPVQLIISAQSDYQLSGRSELCFSSDMRGAKLTFELLICKRGATLPVPPGSRAKKPPLAAKER